MGPRTLNFIRHLPANRRNRRQLWRVSPAQARKLAVRQTRDAGFIGAKVEDGSAVRWWAYSIRRKEVWIVFRKRDEHEQYLLSSSRIVVVCKRTGAVLYVGDACDEG
jgi:hypothetical protein